MSSCTDTEQEIIVLKRAACLLCGTFNELGVIEVDGEGICLCLGCHEEHLKKCCSCGECFIDTEKDHVVDCNGDIYCESCKDDHLSWCEHCERYCDSDNFAHIVDTDQWWCDSCAGNDAYRCEECGDWISSNDGDDNTILCRNCYADHYHICDDCNEVIHNNDAVFYNDGTYCRYCYGENHSSDIRDYSYEPELDFQASKDDHETHLAYLGFELEAGGLSNSCDRNEIVEAIFDDEATFYLKEDGSIPEYGFELVSHPITLKRHKELDWQDILHKMSSGGMRSHDLGVESCGLHVHVSRNYLSPYKWLLIDWLISKYQVKFELIARRQENHFATFKKNNGQPVKDVYGKSNGSRYQAVNFENDCTVEFRLFRGTLKYSTFMATLEIVDALVHWARQVSISNILASRDAFCSFTQFVTANGELYTNAVNYLTEKHLI